MSIRDKLIKAASLFVEVTPDATDTADIPPARELPETAQKVAPPPVTQTKSVEQLVRETPGPDLKDITVAAEPVPDPVKPDGTLNFAALYQRGGLPATAFTAEQLLDMLSTLPKELSIDVKRQTVKASLSAIGKTIGVTPETIVTDASRKLAALTAFVDAVSRQTAELCSQEELAIAALQTQIAEKRKAIDAAHQRQTQVAGACTAEADRLDEVLEFFSLDVPPSKYAQPAPAGKK